MILFIFCFMIFFNSCTEEICHFLLRMITGEPKASMNPTASQNWAKNKRARGGAVIPCNWLLHVQKGQSLKKVAKITNASGAMGSSIDGLKTWK